MLSFASLAIAAGALALELSPGLIAGGMRTPAGGENLAKSHGTEVISAVSSALEVIHNEIGYEEK